MRFRKKNSSRNSGVSHGLGCSPTFFGQEIIFTDTGVTCINPDPRYSAMNQKKAARQCLSGQVWGSHQIGQGRGNADLMTSLYTSEP